MDVSPTFYPVHLKTGLVMDRDLPLRNVKMTGGTGSAPGTFSADLDLMELVNYPGITDVRREWDQTLALIKPWAMSILAVREGLTGVTTVADRPISEWIITEAPRGHLDTVIPLRGIEITGYPAHATVTTARHTSRVDSIRMAYELLMECYNAGPVAATALVDPVPASALTAGLDVTVGAAMYADALRQIQGDMEWEWGIWYADLDHTVQPLRVKRTIAVGAPFLRDNRVIGEGEFAIEAAPPGQPPAGILDYTLEPNLGDAISELHAFGAGSGSAQRYIPLTRAVDPDYPRLSATLQANDARTTEALRSEGLRSLRGLSEPSQTITMQVLTERLPAGGARVGHTYDVTLWESPAIPYPPANAKYRVTSWEWSQPGDGQPDTTILTMMRR